ncbi:MAG TPA: hypothetical protein VFK09_04335 [Gemmatimonadales bacterium]|nr:hypothetical protein [Gemmatimonadales bacterium]
MREPDEPPPIELTAAQRRRHALVLAALGMLGTLGGRVSRDGWRVLLDWRVLAGVAALGLALYLFWRWAIAASLGLARALATRRNARRRPAA